MHSSSRVSAFRQTRLICISWGFALFLVMMSACSSTSVPNLSKSITPVPSSSPIPVLNDLLVPHTLTVGSYMNYLPQEFQDPTTNRSTGFDIDIMDALALRLNLHISWVNEDYSLLLKDLINQQFDAVISAVVITPDLQKKVSFIPYLRSGEALLVSQNNPLHVTGIRSLCGLSVATKLDSAEYDELEVVNDTCQRHGQKGLSLITKTNYADLVQLLKTHMVNVIYLDLSQAAYYMHLFPDQFAVAGSTINPTIEGIAVRLDNASLFHALQIALDQLRRDGTYDRIARQWGLTSSEYSA